MKFLDDRLQETKNTLNQSENAFNQYLVQHSVVGMQLVGQLSERKLNTLEMQIEQLRSQQEELLQIYTPKHPLVIASYNKEKELKKRLEGVKAELLTYPQKNQEESHLKSSILLNNRIYTVLLNHKMQMEFSKAGLTSDLVLLSDATPPTTAATHRLLMTLVSCLIGAFLSSLLLLLRHLLNQTIEDATQLEEAVPLSVQCVVPFSQKQKHMDKLHQKTLKAVGSGLATTPLILAKQDPHDIAIESLRSLKMSLHINASNPNANLGIIALMGCVSGVGKSFTSLNLAQVFADSGKRTLLIDADIRKGRLHRACHLPQSKGLSELLENKLDYSTLTHTIHHNLTLLTCGTHTEHPLKLFQNTFFANVLSQMKADFDQVIIDTPPILPVSDAVLIALQCDIKLFVVSAGIDTIAN
ncbi:MAG: EpsC, partial [uncultured bacterium]